MLDTKIKNKNSGCKTVIWYSIKFRMDIRNFLEATFLGLFLVLDKFLEAENKLEIKEKWRIKNGINK